jgi:uncharacterized protein YjdB
MYIVISSESNAPIPPAGEATLFINTDKNNTLYAKYSDGSVIPYTGEDSAAAALIAETWMQAVTCSLKTGIITAQEFQDIMDQGLTIQSNTTTDDDGNITQTLSVGSRTITLNSITPDLLAVPLAVAGTHQIVITFNPTNVGNKGLSYISSDATKATVSASGLITGVAAGVATITVIPTADPAKAKVITVTVA